MEVVIVALFAAIINSDQGPNKEEAFRRLSSAYLTQTGVVDNVSDDLNKYKDVYLTKEQQAVIGYGLQITNLAIEQRITYKWEF